MRVVRKIDAQLIAAAPELLEACERLVNAMILYGMEVEGDAPVEHRQMMDYAIRAIAKARGDT
jgi:hypothetical protein